MLGNILSTGEQVLILVVLLAVGFLCGKIRIFNDQSISHLSAFALKIVGPCAIVESFCRQFDSAMLRGMEHHRRGDRPRAERRENERKRRQAG